MKLALTIAALAVSVTPVFGADYPDRNIFMKAVAAAGTYDCNRLLFG